MARAVDTGGGKGTTTHVHDGVLRKVRWGRSLEIPKSRGPSLFDQSLLMVSYERQPEFSHNRRRPVHHPFMKSTHGAVPVDTALESLAALAFLSHATLTVR